MAPAGALQCVADRGICKLLSEQKSFCFLFLAGFIGQSPFPGDFKARNNW